MTTTPTQTRRSPVSLSGDEVRTFAALELRAQSAEAGNPDAPFTELTGTAVPYEVWTNVGWFEEKMVRGVFAKSIREAAAQLPLLLWHDNRTFPIGAARKWQESDGGLVGRWALDTDDEMAQTAARKADAGLLTGMSVGFAEVNRAGSVDHVDAETGEVVDVEEWWRLDRPGLVWHEARLLEVSLTPTPAYAGAQVAMVRSSQRRPQEGTGRTRSGEVNHWRRKREGLRRR